MRRFLREHEYAVAFVVLFVAVAVVYWRAEQSIHSVRTLQQSRIVLSCQRTQKEWDQLYLATIPVRIDANVREQTPSVVKSSTPVVLVPAARGLSVEQIAAANAALVAVDETYAAARATLGARPVCT